MGEILSQEEIDALLSAYGSGATVGGSKSSAEKATAHEVRMYDFTRPERFSKDEIRQLEAVNNAFASGFANHLSAVLRTSVEVEHTTLDQISFDEYLKSIPTPTLLTTFKIEPDATKCIIEINPNIVFTLVDLLAGGTGDAQLNSRDMTDIELKLMESVIRMALAQYTRAWEPFFNIDCSIDRVGASQMVNPIASGQDRMVCAYFEARLGGQIGLISICLPSFAVEQILKAFAEDTAEQNESFDSALRLMIADNLAGTRVVASARLGETSVTVAEMINLQEGDVIRLTQPVNREIVMTIEGEPKFYGVPGLIGRHVGMHITREYGEDLYSANKEAA